MLKQHPVRCGAALAVAIALWVATPLMAIETHTVREDTYNTLVHGELKAAALSSDGFIEPSLARRLVGDTGTEIVWAALREPGGTVLCATGHQGRLMRVIDEQTSQTLASFPEPELTAMTRAADGSVLIAAAPSGRIYRLGADDALSTVTQLDTTWIWRMLPDADGAIWIASGVEGRLFKLTLTADGATTELAHEFKSKNLLDLWLDREGAVGPQGALYIGGQDPGWLYRRNPDGAVEVVYDAQAEEVRAILPLPGEGLALALNTERAPSPQAFNLTLRMAGGGTAGLPMAPPPPPSPAAQQQMQQMAQAFAKTQQAKFGPPRSEIALLLPSGFTRTIWQSPERPIHAMATSPAGHLLVAVGNEGHVFEVKAGGEFAIVADLRDEYIVNLTADEQGYLLGAARNGRVFHMDRERAEEAVYISRAIDASAPAKWGRFYIRGEQSDAQRVLAAFRLGNDGDPESELWSEWTEDQPVAAGAPVQPPAGPARYLQYRLTLRQGEAGTPVRVDYAELFFVGRNAPPFIGEINVAEPPAQPKPGQPPRPPQQTQPQNGNPGAENPGPGAQSTAASGRESDSNPRTVQIAWQAADPNGDALRFALYFRADDETVWKLIDDELTQPQVPLGIGGVADGRYRFKVVATDAFANPPGAGLTAEKVSDEIIIDKTPPAFSDARTEVQGRRATIRLALEDSLSLISTLKIDLDNGDAYPLMPTDGIMDQAVEGFEWTSEELEPGEHLATFNATDRAGNTAVHKVVFTIP